MSENTIASMLERGFIFDTETTDRDEPVLIEAAGALCVIDGGTVFTSFHVCSRYNPGKPISTGAMATHGIMDEDLVGFPPPSDFKLPDNASYLIGHNVDFDWEVIGKPDIKRICTLAIARRLWPDTSHSQGALMFFLERQRARQLTKNAHNALADIDMCLVIVQHILMQTGIKTLAELHAYSEECRVPTHFTFGKHKGARIDEVPLDYINWMLRQDDVDQYLQIALRKVKGELLV